MNIVKVYVKKKIFFMYISYFGIESILYNIVLCEYNKKDEILSIDFM